MGGVDQDGPVQLNQRLNEIEKVVNNWWNLWQRDAFPLFCPKKKWTTAHRNLQIGDIVMLRYDQKLGKDKYRLAKVVETDPDNEGHVRTVTITLRDLKKTRKEKPNESNTPPAEMTVGVQRLVVLLPVEENWVAGLTTDNQTV